MKRKIIKYIVLSSSIFFGIFFASSAIYAHHIRGLPHYGYSENYPQIPTYEEIRIIDDWEIIFSYVKIFETNNCDLAIYLKNTKTGKPFSGSVNFKVFGERDDPQKVHSFDALIDPTNTFRVGWVFEEDGIYILRIKFHDGKKEYIEDFRMQMGEVGFNFFWIILPGSVVLILILLIAFKRFKGKEES